MDRSELRARCEGVTATKRNPEAAVLVDARAVLALLARLDEAERLLREFDQRKWTDTRPGFLWVDRIRAFLASSTPTETE